MERLVMEALHAPSPVAQVALDVARGQPQRQLRRTRRC